MIAPGTHLQSWGKVCSSFGTREASRNVESKWSGFLHASAYCLLLSSSVRCSLKASRKPTSNTAAPSLNYWTPTHPSRIIFTCHFFDEAFLDFWKSKWIALSVLFLEYCIHISVAVFTTVTSSTCILPIWHTAWGRSSVLLIFCAQHLVFYKYLFSEWIPEWVDQLSSDY